MLYSLPIPHIPTNTMNFPQASLVFDRSGKAVSAFHGVCGHIDVAELVELFRNGAELLPKKRRPSQGAIRQVLWALEDDLGKLAAYYPPLSEAVPHPRHLPHKPRNLEVPT